MKSALAPASDPGGFFVSIATSAGSTTKKVDGDLLLVGRADDCHLTIAHETMSRRHLTIALKNGECWVEDHGSSNGSFVNGKRLKPHSAVRVRPEDRITMGQSNVTLNASVEPQVNPADASSPDIELEKSSAGLIGSNTQADRQLQRESVVAKIVPSHDAPENISRALQDAQKRASDILQLAETEAERRAEEIYRRAHETQAKMDEVYQKRTNEAYRAAEEIFQKAHAESQTILESARQRSAEIRRQAETFVLELRRRTEEECERLLGEAQQTARDLKEQRLLEADDLIKKRERELVADARATLESRVARFESDLTAQVEGERARLQIELNDRRRELEEELSGQVEQIKSLQLETVDLRELRAREQAELSEIEFGLKSRRDENKKLKDEVEAGRATLAAMARELAELKGSVDAAALGAATAEESLDGMRGKLGTAQAELARVERMREQAEDQLEHDHAQLRTEFEERKIQIENLERAHREQLTFETNKRIADLERGLIEELENKRLTIARELALAIENLIRDRQSIGSVQIQATITEHLESQISTLSHDENADQKQVNLFVQRRRQRYYNLSFGLFLGVAATFAGQRGLDYLRREGSPMQRRVVDAAAERQADLEARKFSPPQTRDYKSTYVDNVVYTENFVNIYTGDAFQKALMQNLSRYMLRTWKTDEDKVIELLSVTSALVKTLDEKRQAIHPDFVPQGLQKMREAEAETQERLRKLLGSQVRVESFRKYEKEFYEHQAEAGAPTAPRVPSSATPNAE